MLHEISQRNEARPTQPRSAEAATPTRALGEAGTSDACDCATRSAKPDDATLVAGCLRGEGKSWEALVKRYQRLVYTIVRRMGMDEHMAADVFQTVFSRLLTHLPRIGDPSRLQAWIVTTAKREALLQRRRGERTVSMTDDSDADASSNEWDVADPAPQAEDALDRLQQIERVRQALDRLDPRSRRLMDMLFADEGERTAYLDMAEQLDIAVGSIGPTRARCLAKLRKFLD
jgi:RNA polymerase sigma factor (sigma-70 family)